MARSSRGRGISRKRGSGVPLKSQGKTTTRTMGAAPKAPRMITR